MNPQALTLTLALGVVSVLRQFCLGNGDAYPFPPLVEG